ncbi:MAG: type II secretion system protein GspJ [Azoarcus sp.]|nr:type II secretion system protein GspJ [Azoarcus sp.]
MTRQRSLVRPAPARQQAQGLTLVELLVALTVFAVLGVLSYRAVGQMSLLETHVGERQQRWRDLERSAHRIETDLLQLAGTSTGQPSLRLVPLPRGGSELQLQIFDGARSRVEQVSLRFSQQQLYRLSQPAAGGGSAGAQDLLLDHVGQLRWRFLHGGTRIDSWPPPGVDPNALPAAVELQLDLPDLGTLTRIVALR